LEFLAVHGGALLFYLFALIAVVGALGVVTLRNPMYGAISLLTTFLAVAVLFFLRSAEFVAVVQIFVYGGGIMVLFLFVIMLVNQQHLMESDKYGPNKWLAVGMALVMAALLTTAFLPARFADPATTPAAFSAVGGAHPGNAEAVAWLLYRQYLMPFEIVSVFLLVAMVGAVVLGRRQ
jgi:NADH-quinone oxidoreductase subunit J